MRFICVLFLATSFFNSYSQPKATYEERKKNAELRFKNILANGIRQKLNKENLGKDGFAGWMFYRYKIVRLDSNSFEFVNSVKDSIDSYKETVNTIVKKEFLSTVDSLRNTRELKYLVSDSYIYVPLVVIYHGNPQKNIKEELPLEVLSLVYGYDYNGELGNPDPILKVMAPIVCRLPLVGRYY